MLSEANVLFNMPSALFFPVLTHHAILTDLVLLAAAKINLMCTYCVCVAHIYWQILLLRVFSTGIREERPVTESWGILASASPRSNERTSVKTLVHSSCILLCLKIFRILFIVILYYSLCQLRWYPNIVRMLNSNKMFKSIVSVSLLCICLCVHA